MKNVIFKQIKNLTQTLIKNGAIISYNFPSLRGNEISWENYKNLSFSLKDESYDIVYEKIIRSKDYNFLMLDGAAIQMQYIIANNHIKSSILRYYPSPNNESFKDVEDLFEGIYYGNEYFS